MHTTDRSHKADMLAVINGLEGIEDNTENVYDLRELLSSQAGGAVRGRGRFYPV